MFLSVLFLEGAARYLFMRMAMAVGFSVMASYFLSRTIIPTLVMYLLKDEVRVARRSRRRSAGDWQRRARVLQRGSHAQPGSSGASRASATATSTALDWALHHRKTVFATFGVAVVAAAALVPFVGRDFFPTVDAGQIRLHVTAPAGTRIEETEKHFTAVAEAVRELDPEHDRDTIIDIIGVPDGINLAVTDSNILSSADGEMLVAPDRAPQHGHAAST